MPVMTAKIVESLTRVQCTSLPTVEF